MAIEKNDSCGRKEIYRLWWEYLKRSEGFKAYCEKHPDAVKNSELFGTYSIDTSHNRESPEDDVIVDPNYDEFRKEQMKWKRATCFGNVHKDSFEAWWEKFKQLSEKEKNVEELSSHIDRLMKH